MTLLLQVEQKAVLVVSVIMDLVQCMHYLLILMIILKKALDRLTNNVMVL